MADTYCEWYDIPVQHVAFGGVALAPALYPAMWSAWHLEARMRGCDSTGCPFPRVWDVLRAPNRLKHRWLCSRQTPSFIINNRGHKIKMRTRALGVPIPLLFLLFHVHSFRCVDLRLRSSRCVCFESEPCFCGDFRVPFRMREFLSTGLSTFC